jgi:thioredoxin 1
MNIKQIEIGEIDEADFMSEVLQSKLPVIVAFVAPWNKPCQSISPVLDNIARAYAVRVRIVSINVDDYPTLTAWYQIRSVPTLLCFVHGKVCFRIVGAATKEAILSELEPFLPNVQIVLVGAFTPQNSKRKGP